MTLLNTLLNIVQTLFIRQKRQKTKYTDKYSQD